MRPRVIPRLQHAFGLLVALSVVAGCGAAATNTPAASTGATVSGTIVATKAAALAATAVATTQETAAAAATTAATATKAATVAAAVTATTAPTAAASAPTAASGGAAMPTADAALAPTGATEAQSAGCLGYHTIDGTKKVGPTWQGLYGSQVTLTDGSTVVADDAYVRESITIPDAKVVQGFQAGVMPKVGSTLSGDQLSSLVAYIESLGTP